MIWYRKVLFILNYGLDRIEYKLLILLVNKSERVVVSRDDITGLKDYAWSISSEGVDLDVLASLLDKGILEMYMYEKKEEQIIFKFTKSSRIDMDFREFSSLNADVAAGLKTESGLLLYEYIMLNGEIENDTRMISVSVDELRDIFKCNEVTYRYYKDLRVRKLDPAIKDLNSVDCKVYYDVVKNGTKVERVNIYKQEEKRIVYKDIDIKKDCKLQEAIGEICEVLLLYSIKLSVSPKNYEEYLLAFEGNMHLANYDLNKENCVKTRVFRSDLYMNKSPLVICATEENDEIIYKIEYRKYDEVIYQWEVKEVYDVLIALENIKYAILQGNDLRSIDLYNKNSLQVELNNAYGWGSYFEIPKLYKIAISIMDEFNKNNKSTFRYIFSIKCDAESGLTHLDIEYEGSSWRAEMYEDNTDYEYKIKLSNSYEDGAQHIVCDLKELFKIVCKGNAEEEVSKVVDHVLDKFIEC